MKTGRLEAFSDGVFAIIITIMVLNMKAPSGTDWADLSTVAPGFISYIISYMYVGIYWNNHHHLFQAVEKVNGKLLWLNLILLFCLSLLPFTTSWMGDNHFTKVPVTLYGVNLFLCAISFTFLENIAIKFEGHTSALGKALSNKKKEKASIAIYLLSLMISFYFPTIALLGYATVALIWLIPDTRIEHNFK